MSKCKYYLEKEVVSYDGGITWNETGVTRKGNLYEESSEDCTDPSVQYRWINMNISTGWICDGTNKYYKQKKQVSYDGIIWQDVTPAEYQRGSIYEVNSPDCQPTYRWVNLDISTDYICDGTTKYYKQKKQVSYGGQEWQDVIPYEYQRGDVYETQSKDCGYVVLPKFQATYSGGQTYEKECDSNTTLASGETRPSGYEHSAMTSAVIGSCVNEIGADAFWTCSGLTSVTIPNSVTSIGAGAFAFCDSLTSVTIPDSVTSIGRTAFQNCSSLTNINIPSGVTIIDDWTFAYCSSLTGITIPNGVTIIDSAAFAYCSSLTSIDIPNSVTEFGPAFAGCSSLTSVTIGSGVTSIEGGAFSRCTSLTSIGLKGSGASVEIPNSVTTIGLQAFSACTGLASVDIPDSVTEIESSVFRDCTSLTSVTIGSGVTTIGAAVFSACTSLTSVTVNAITPPEMSWFVFDGSTCPIYVPANSVNAYKTASGWSSYASRIQAIP